MSKGQCYFWSPSQCLPNISKSWLLILGFCCCFLWKLWLVDWMKGDRGLRPGGAICDADCQSQRAALQPQSPTLLGFVHQRKVKSSLGSCPESNASFASAFYNIHFGSSREVKTQSCLEVILFVLAPGCFLSNPVLLLLRPQRLRVPEHRMCQVL